MASDLLLGTTVVSCCLFGIMVASDWFYERMMIIGWVFGNNSGQWLIVRYRTMVINGL